MTPFVVDANVIVAFQDERISQTPGPAVSAINAITSDNCIALDPLKQCLQEWMEGAAGRFPFLLMDWVDEMIASGRIKYFDLHDTSIRKHLQRIGLPKKDHKWVRLAIGSNGKKIVTEDIDFFDPNLKSAKSTKKLAVKQARTGPCAKELRDIYDVSVMCLCHIQEELDALKAKGTS